ncbi:MAG: hypothetical protein EP330_01155 [Deltaproteobacteria bacterium]|nr:MAG: hypothetical protein EP330_01155 [Deltaproteobacteria bacterium]
MMRLTLRSGRDGRFLARVVEQAGFAYVLDFGDDRIIEDVSQRLRHGFTMWRFGRLITAAPTDPDFVQCLAEFYSGEGLLVFLEEPAWPGRLEAPDAGGHATDPAGFAIPELDELTDEHELEDIGEEEPETEWAEPETEIADRDALSPEVAQALGIAVSEAPTVSAPALSAKTLTPSMAPDLEADLAAAMEAPPLPISAHLGLPELEFEDPCTEELPLLELDED